MIRAGYATLAAAFVALTAAADEAPTMASVLAAATDADWQPLAQERLLYLELDSGTVVFETADDFAPQHLLNLRKLTGAGYFDGLAIIRSQDNYVVQWGDPQAGSENARSHGEAAERLPPEFFRALDGLGIAELDDRDAYADTVGFVDGMPVAADSGRAWLAHCYGMLGAGRGNEPDSGSGAELYVVTGHAPRHLDRNVTLLGRTVKGIELLSSLPRGTAALGFYESPDEHVPIRRLRFGDQLGEESRLQLERLKTGTDTFRKLVAARRHRAEAWFADPADRIGLCNVPIPVRPAGE